jgi:aminoglycoside phosphotransferase (APT) family kinase protein
MTDTTAHEIPIALADLTPGWLSGALGREVTGVEMEPIGEGVGIVGQLARVHLTGADELPATIVAKMHSLHPENQGIAMHYGLYATEAGFYRDCAHQMGVRVPVSYYADASADGSTCVLLMEDMTGATALDQVAGCSPEVAEVVVDHLATLHSRWWESPALDELGWLRPINNDAYKSVAGHMGPGLDVIKSQYAHLVPAESIAAAEHWAEVVADVYDWTFHNRPLTLAHTDLRLDNLFFDHPDGSPLVIIDWQLTVRSLGPFDVSYFLTESLTVEDRRAHEERLVRRYHAGLVAGGVTDYSFDDCWNDYLLSMASQFSITVVAALMNVGNERGQALANAMVERQFTAVADHDVMALLKDLPI